MQRGRVTAGVLLLAGIIGPQVASEVRPGLHGWLVGHCAVSWPVVMTEPWRLAVSPLVQPRAGLVGTEWLFALAVVPVFLGVRGPRSLAAYFWGADFAGTAPVLLTLGAASAWSGRAAALAATPDCGASAGLFGVAVAAAWRLPRGAAGVALGGIGAFLLIRLGLFHRLYDVEHSLAVAGAAAACWLEDGVPGQPARRGFRARRAYI